MVFDETDFVSAQFWKSLRKQFTTGEPNLDNELERALLQMLFVVALETGPMWFEIDMTTLLGHLRNSRDDREFDQYWRRFCDDIRLNLDIPKSAQIFTSRIDRAFFGGVYQAMQSALSATSNGVESLFDYLFFSNATKSLGVSPRYTNMVAQFSSLLAGRKSNRVEAFALTGEFLNANSDTSRRTARAPGPTIVQSFKGWEFELRLRVALFGQRITTIDEGSDGSISLKTGDFVLIDAPRRRTNFTHSTFRAFRATSSANSAFQMLDVLLDRNHFIEGVVMVRGSDRTATTDGIRRVRDWLVESKSLIAVIDFPSGNRNPSPSHSAWVLRAHPKAQLDQILMADMRVLLPENYRDSWSSLATFAAHMVLTWEGKQDRQEWLTDEDSQGIDKRLHNIFLREFGEGYRDVSGLCSVISREEVRNNASRLQARDYLASQEPRTWASGLDYACIVQILNARRKLREPIYVIGNNGEGKSLLLRELAEVSTREGRATIGVSFGFNDRFQHQDKKSKGYEFFRYEGARSSSATSSGKKIALDMGKKMFQIHCDPHRLAAFNLGLELLDFRARRYLVPFEVRAGDRGNASIVSATVELSDVAADNVGLIGADSLANMQPALGRNKSRNEITSYTELSSGEQQMLALMVKVVVAAESKALILIDEPEISLHVTWQRLLPLLLSRMCKHFRCDMVIATHSPILVSSALNTSPHCFVAKDQQLTYLSTRERGSVERVLFTGFKTHTENNRQVHERCAAIIAEAIQIVNSRGGSQPSIEGLYTELDSIQETVMLAVGQLREASLEKDLVLIHKTREALDQLRMLARPKRSSGR